MINFANKPGVHEQILPDNGALYTVSLPQGYSPEVRIPLIMVLHWGGPAYPYFGRAILEGLILPAWGGLNAIMSAPDCRHGRWNNPESEAEVLCLLTYLKTQYPIDEGKVLLTGYSMGGIGAWYVAASNQDRFGAVVPIASIPPLEVQEVDWNIPIYVINSRQDELFPYEQAEMAVEQLHAAGADVQFVLLDGPTHFETGGYYPSLIEAAGWIQAVWRK